MHELMFIHMDLLWIKPQLKYINWVEFFKIEEKVSHPPLEYFRIWMYCTTLYIINIVLRSLIWKEQEVH